MRKLKAAMEINIPPQHANNIITVFRKNFEDFIFLKKSLKTYGQAPTNIPIIIVMYTRDTKKFLCVMGLQYTLLNEACDNNNNNTASPLIANSSRITENAKNITEPKSQKNCNLYAPRSASLSSITLHRNHIPPIPSVTSGAYLLYTIQS